MRRNLLLFGILSLFLFSCSSDDDSNTTNSFVGNWTGQYTGNQDNGNWNVNVDENNEVSGTVTSSVFNETYQLQGQVAENGTLTATFGSTSVGGEFEGQLNSNNSASGTWVNTGANMSGTWSGNKN